MQRAHYLQADKKTRDPKQSEQKRKQARKKHCATMKNEFEQ